MICSSTLDKYAYNALPLRQRSLDIGYLGFALFEFIMPADLADSMCHYRRTSPASG
jgi:hypothetical protein